MFLILVIVLAAGHISPATAFAGGLEDDDWVFISYNLYRVGNGYELYDDGKDFEESLRTPGDEIGALPVPVREGYDFKGWYLVEDPNSSTDPKHKASPQTVIVDNGGGEMNLYARWDAQTCSIFFDSNGGSQPQQLTRALLYDEEIGALEEDLTRDGYTFKGWYTSATGGTKVKSTDPVKKKELRLYAQWTPLEYSLTLEPEGGTLAGDATKTVKYDQPYGAALSNPTRDNYDFAGWYTEPDGGTKVTSTTKYTTLGSSTLYARWTIKPAPAPKPTPKPYVAPAPVQFKVTFNGNKGKIKKKKTQVVMKVQNTTVGKLPKPTRKGYKFKGWYTKKKKGKKIKASAKVTKNITYYAQWKKK